MDFTGGTGMPEISFMLAAFCGGPDLFSCPKCIELTNVGIDDEMCELPNLKVLAATAAANCGIISNLCHRSYQVDPSSNLYDVVQEMGRTDRDIYLMPGLNRYKIHVSWPTIVLVYVCIMQNPDGPEREQHLVN